jgi:hypothetical protein
LYLHIPYIFQGVSPLYFKIYFFKVIIFQTNKYKQMKKTNILALIMITFSLLIFNTGFTQLDYMFEKNLGCALNGSYTINQTYTGYQLPFFPMSNDTLRALVVFVNFADENFDPHLYPTPGDSSYVFLNYWPGSYPEYLTKPSWADSVICPTTTNVWNRSLTALFRDGSLGKFWLIGDVYPSLVVVNNKSTYAGRGIGTVVKDVITQIEPNVNWAYYDKFAPFDGNNRNHSDGIVDFIFIMIRFNNSGSIEGSSYTGICGLGGFSGNFGYDNFNQPITEINVGKKKIISQLLGSGCIAEVNSPWDHLGYAAHEFCQHYGYGFVHNEKMGSFNINGGNLACASDREYFGWSSSTPYAPTSNTTITLRDYVTTNDYVKIQRSSDAIFLENRRRLSYYASENYKIWKIRSYEPLRPVGSDSMLVIYRRNNINSFNIESANGNWDWQMCGSSYKSKAYSGTFNFFYNDISNRFGGTSTFSLREKPIKDTNCNSYPFNAITYMGVDGDSTTCFDVGYNEVYSPWSNPPLPVNNVNDSLAIEIAGKDNNGDLIVNIYFTNILQGKPSKPQGLQISWSECINEVNYPQITWQHNLEPDMIQPFTPPFDYKRYKIFRAYANINNGELPGPYQEIAEQNFRADIPPVFIDYNASVECNSRISQVNYNVWYKVKAVDNTNNLSTYSNDVSTQTLKVWDYNGDNLIINSNIPKTFTLNQNYPNPFNPVTNIQYDLPKDVFVKIKIYDLLGREIKTLVNEFKNAGSYLVSFNGSEFASGIYFYRIQVVDPTGRTGSFVQVKRMVLIK